MLEVEEEKELYESLLRLSMRLLCEHKPEEVIHYVKKKYYPPELCLAICKHYKINNALAYIYNHTGLYAEALNTYVALLNETHAELLDSKGENRLLAVYAKYFRHVIKLCRKLTTQNEAAAEKYWNSILKHIKAVLLKLGEGSDMLRGCISDCTRRFVAALVEHYDIEEMIRSIVDYCGELGVESFREALNSSIVSYTLQQKILGSAQEIVRSCISKGFAELTREKFKAISVERNVCTKCKQEIEIKRNVQFLPFLCGHVYHYNCLSYINKCEVCLSLGEGNYYFDGRVCAIGESRAKRGEERRRGDQRGEGEVLREDEGLRREENEAFCCML